MTTATISTADLKKALAVVKAASHPKSNLATLGGVRLDISTGELRVTCTDLEILATFRLDAEATSNGSAVVNAKDLSATIPAGKGSTTVTLDDDGYVDFAFGATSARLATMPVDEWPNRLAHDVTASAMAASSPFAEVMPAVGKDYARPILTRVKLTGRELAATDSYRLVVAERPVGEPELEGQIDQRQVAMALKVGAETWRIGISEQHVTIYAGDLAVTGCNGDYLGEFPRYHKLIPTNPSKVLDMAGALDVVKAAAKADKVGPVRLSVNGAIAVSTSNGLVNAELPLGATDADGLTVAFNPRYLADALAGSDGQVLLTDALKPAVIRTPSSVRLLMPVRIS